MEELNECGFVFLDDANTPYWCRMYHGQPWLMRWNFGMGAFCTLRPVTQTEVWEFPHNLTEEQQAYYRDKHNSTLEGIQPGGST